MKPNLDEKRHLDALLARLRALKPFETYPLDSYERHLLLSALAQTDEDHVITSVEIAASEK